MDHELRTPVAALQLQLTVLDEDPNISKDSRQMLSRMSSAIGRLTRLIESLLHRASIEGGRMIISEEQVDPAQLVRKVVQESSREAESMALELRLQAQTEVGELETDPQFLRLILANLVRNALRYTDEGHVTLDIARGDDGHRFAVTDTGPGIAPEDRVRLFALFERGGDARRRQLPGTGLGLALVRDLTQALGGNIELESEVGIGSTFTVLLLSDGNADLSDEVSHE